MYAGYLTQAGPGNLTPYHTPEDPQWSTLEETKNPLLVVFGSEDVYIKPSVSEAVAQIKSHCKSAESIVVEVIEGAGHSYLNKETQLVNVIQSWIRALLNNGN